MGNLESKLEVEVFCCNPYCEHPACTVAKGRPFCDACLTAYHWGRVDAIKNVLRGLERKEAVL